MPLAPSLSSPPPPTDQYLADLALASTESGSAGDANSRPGSERGDEERGAGKVLCTGCLVADEAAEDKKR
jgi:hypothetical protein